MLHDSCRKVYILSSENESVDTSKNSETATKTEVHPLQKNESISKIKYLGIGISAILIFIWPSEGAIFGLCLATIFIGRIIYRAFKQANSELIFVKVPTTPYMAPTLKKIANKAIVVSTDLVEEMQHKINEAKNHAIKKKQYIESIKIKSTCTPVEVVILGGAGWEIMTNKKFIISMDASTIYMSDLDLLIDTSININTLKEIDISGPGKVTNNAGVIGGGFGAEGALKGMAVATVINMLSTYSNTKTFIRLGFQSSEVVMLTSQIEPDKARILLSPLFLKINRRSMEQASLGAGDEIKKLYELQQNGAITDLEFERLKSNLIDRI